MTMPRSRVREAGFTLVELMVSLVLGALVVLAATAMVVTSRATYRLQDEGTRISESGRAGLELGNRLVRLAGYTNFGQDTTLPPAYTPDAAWVAAPDAYAITGPNMVGANNSAPSGNTVVNSSDSLTIRFYGSGNGTADGTILDCAGSAVAAPALTATSYSERRAYNVLFVGPDVDGEPSLRCLRQKINEDGTTSVDVQTLIRGVEDFQVLYGELIPPPGGDLDLVDPLSIVYRTGIGGSNPVLNWDNVQTVRIAMLIRSATGVLTGPEPTTTTYKLFGADYDAAAGSADPGSTFALAGLSDLERTRVRRVVQTTVFIRNRVASWPSLQRP